MAKRRALITGITGQDGCYLAQLLLAKGYEVFGAAESARPFNGFGLEYLGIQNQVQIRRLTLLAEKEVDRLIAELLPDEIYHLAGQSSVALSFAEPQPTFLTNTAPTLNLLDAFRRHLKGARFFHASSSEMFGDATQLPITLSTPMTPKSPYGASKVAAHNLVRVYRESFNLFCVSGVMFNHESFLRRQGFFTKKLIRAAIEISEGKREKLLLGDLTVKRDFGYAPEYVVAMWQMLQSPVPRDIMVCSGVAVSLESLVRQTFNILNLPMSLCQVDPSLLRPNELHSIYGCTNDAQEYLGWKAKMPATAMIEVLVKEEIAFRKTSESAATPL